MRRNFHLKAFSSATWIAKNSCCERSGRAFLHMNLVDSRCSNAMKYAQNNSIKFVHLLYKCCISISLPVSSAGAVRINSNTARWAIGSGSLLLCH